MKALLTTLACCSLCAAALPAAGEEVHSARADALFQQAQTLLDAGKVEAACSKLEASEAAGNSLETLLHLGDCYERAGRSASAWHAFQEAEAVAHAKKDADREQVAADRESQRLEPKLMRRGAAGAADFQPRSRSKRAARQQYSSGRVVGCSHSSRRWRTAFTSVHRPRDIVRGNWI